MGVFGGERQQRHLAEEDIKENRNETNGWADLEEQYSGDQHVSWDDLKNEPGAARLEKEVQPDSANIPESGFYARVEAFVDPYEPELGPEGFDHARRQRKIVAAFESEDGADAMNLHDVLRDPYWEDQFSQDVIDGRIDDAAEKNFLAAIPADMEKRPGSETLALVAEDPDTQRVFQVLTSGHTDEKGLRELVEPRPGRKDCRTILDFVEFKMNYLKGYENDRQEYDKIEKGLDNLSGILYGDEQIKYYKAFESLKQRAYYNEYRAHSEKFGSEPSAQGEDVSERRQNGFGSEAFGREEKIPRVMTESEGERLLTNAVVDGDPFERSDGSWNLTPEGLRDFGLGPKYESSANGARICLSDIYELSNNRQAVVAYVPTDEDVKVRTYYKSNSQGLWRYLPDYVRKDDGSGTASWYGKGYDEASLTLPAELQKDLAQIERTGVKDISQKTSPWFVFLGTAKAYNSKDEYGAAFKNGTLRGDYYREVSRTPLNVGFESTLGQKPHPEQVQISGGLAPNLEQVVFEYDGNSSLAGEFQAECFRSQDGSFVWSFFNDAKGRAWVGNVDVKTAPTSTGVGRDWIQLGDIETPIYEHSFQDGGYGDQSDVSKGYVGMWKNYLSKIPLIREYKQWRDARRRRS